MTSSAELGRQLEERVAAFFGTHGYATSCNEVLEGRSGGRHEVDVLAEKSDALTTYRVGIECKAWQHPIEKGVVSKLHYVLGDLGLNKGIIVSLAGRRSGAERTAADLGIDVWGPDELRRHLGETAVDELGLLSVAGGTTAAWGYGLTVPLEVAKKKIWSAGKGRLRLRTRERLLWFSPVWVPAYVVRLTIAQPEVRRLKTRLRSSTLVNLYEALGGQFIGGVPAPWEQVQLEQQDALRALMRETKIHAALRKAVQGFSRVSSAAAVERHAANLLRHGIPAPCSSLSIDETSTVYLPHYVGILESAGRQRAVAVTGWTGDESESLSQVLTMNIAQLRNQFAVDGSG